MSTQFKLGINAGFAINRFPEPEVWLRIVGKELGLKYVQFEGRKGDRIIFLGKTEIGRETKKQG